MPERPEQPTGASVRRDVERRLAMVESLDRRVGSLVHIDVESALARADALDGLSAAERGPLHGVIAAVKDNIDVAGQVTACCSPAGRDRTPATADAPVVTALIAAGAVVLGRANMDELAMGASTATSRHGPTRNPHDHRRSPGGSSGGCAAAVALGLVDLAIGTDTGGSIREPASQCGVWGLAPTPGLVPTVGIVPFAPSCDRVGPLVRDPDLLRRALRVMTAPGVASHPRARPSDQSSPRRRLALPLELIEEPNQPGVRRVLAEAVARATAAGHVVEEVSLADARGALAAYLVLTSVECLPHLRPWTSTGLAGSEVARRTRIGRGLLTDTARLTDAGDLQDRLRAQCADVLERFDALVSPTMPTTAPLFAPAGPPTRQVADPMTAPYTDSWTVVANVAGLPALSVPAGISDEDDMPVGVMLMGAPGTDEMLLDLGGDLAPLARPPE